MLLQKEDTIRKRWVDKAATKLNADNNEKKKYKVEVI